MNDMIYKLIEFYIKNTIKNKNKVGRPNKKHLKHYIKVIFNTLKTGIQWKYLKEELHYTTYHKKFLLWNSYNVFQNVYYILIKILEHNNILNKNILKELYIDSTMIKNIKGSEFIGPNHYDRNRNGNKISIVVTSNGIPLGMTLSTSNVHDISIVEDTIDDIKVNIVGSKLGADKGYISEALKDKLKKQRNIDLITYKRKNTKKILNNNEIKFLNKRYIVENTFSWLKNNKKLINRFETKALNFEQYWYLSFINLIFNKFKTLQCELLDIKIACLCL
jgi:hypothetical protein